MSEINITEMGQRISALEVENADLKAKLEMANERRDDVFCQMEVMLNQKITDLERREKYEGDKAIYWYDKFKSLESQNAALGREVGKLRNAIERYETAIFTAAQNKDLFKHPDLQKLWDATVFPTPSDQSSKMTGGDVFHQMEYLLNQKINGLEVALLWALKFISDGTDPESGETPEHDCEFKSNPESGECRFHVEYFAAWAMLGKDKQNGTKK